MARAVRVYFKKQLRLDRLTFPQQAMARIGFAGVTAIRQRLQAGLGPADLPAKPLTKRYKAYKLKRGLKPIRDLFGTGEAFGNQLTRATKRRKTGRRFVGHMLDNFTVRTVTENQARLGTSTFAARVKAWANQQREPWMVLSPRNRTAVRAAASIVLNEVKNKLVKIVSVRRVA